MELTSRCNLGCEHCYINKPIGDKYLTSKEITLSEIDKISNDALDLGTLWISLSGGEPLLRDDFNDIYLMLKKKGFLVSVLTNATLMTKEHIDLIEKYPPRTLEMSIYGMTEKTTTRVTGKKNVLASFLSGFNMAVNKGFDIILKTVKTPSIAPELKKMERFAAQYENVVFKVEDRLISRLDQGETLVKRFSNNGLQPLSKAKHTGSCNPSKSPYINRFGGNLFLCQAGISSCWISSDANIHLCTTLRCEDFAYSLKQGNFKEYWETIVPTLLGTFSTSTHFKKTCSSCKDRAICG